MNQYKNNPLFSEENVYPYKVENKNPPSILKHFIKDPFFLLNETWFSERAGTLGGNKIIPL